MTVNSTKQYQKIYGFGGAFTDSATINMRSLSEEARQKLLEAYFSPDGIEYNMGRIPISGSDFSTRPYTYNDKEFDVTLANFNLSYEDIDYKVGLIAVGSTFRLQIFKSVALKNRKLGSTGNRQRDKEQRFSTSWCL